MTWTYDGDPSANDRDEVRYLVGDTDTSSQLTTDEEIAYAVAEEADNLMAAARVAKALAAKFARLADKAVGDLNISYSQRQEAYLNLAKELETRSNRSGAPPYAGGISISDKETVVDNDDRVEPAFRKGMNDNPGVSTEQGRLDNIS